MKKASAHILLVLFTIVVISIFLIWKFTSAKASSGINYVALGDSITQMTPGWVDIHKGNIETDLNTTANLTNLGFYGWSTAQLLDAIQNNQTYKNAIKNAQLITIEIGINDFQFGVAYYRDGEQCGTTPPTTEGCLISVATNYQTRFDQIVKEIRKLNSSPALTIRAMDIYYPFVNHDKQSGEFTIFKPYLDQMNNFLYTYGASNNVPIARVHTLFNGPDGDQDAFTLGYANSATDPHPNPTGSSAIANQFRNLGYGSLSVDRDGDSIADLLDNCLNTANNDQANFNNEIVSLPKPKYSFDDVTNVIGDNVGDACDADSDHDGLTNAQEATLGTNPSNPDTDGDGIIDGAENKCGSDPNSASSTIKSGGIYLGVKFVFNGTTPSADTDNDGVSDSCEAAYGSNPNLKDTDGDLINDATEILRLGSNPTKADSDGDNCPDAVELANINGDRVINTGDQGLLSSVYGSKKGDANYVADFDMNRDGVINTGDQGFQSSQYGKSCPATPPSANP